MVYKRLLLFLFQLTAASVATFVRQLGEKNRFASLPQCVLSKKCCHTLQEVFCLFVCLQ